MRKNWLQFALYFAGAAIAGPPLMYAQSPPSTSWIDSALTKKEAVFAKHPKDLPVITKTLRRGEPAQMIDVNIENVNE